MEHCVLTPWNTVLLENLTGFQVVKKFPALYGTRRLFTVFASARHLSRSSIEHLRIVVTGVCDRITVFAAIIVGEVEKLSGVCEQVVGIRGVDIPKHDGSCSEGGGCLAGQIRPLRLQNAIFSAVNK
jgi:hypothetical protein